MPSTDNDPASTYRPALRKRSRFMQHRVRLIVGVVVVLLVATGLIAIAAPPAAQYDVASPLLGHRAPVVSASTLGGARFALASRPGHYVVVDFFASWCVPCRKEEPQLVTFAKEHLGSTSLVAVIFNDSVSDVRPVLGPWIGLYPVLVDHGGQIAQNFGVGQAATKFLVNPKGVVVAKIIGGVTSRGLDNLIVAIKSRNLSR